jgi:hypothetical protein
MARPAFVAASAAHIIGCDRCKTRSEMYRLINRNEAVVLHIAAYSHVSTYYGCGRNSRRDEPTYEPIRNSRDAIAATGR